ncbi:MAG: family peptidase [Patescibacteria group bacterium]|nr:family peptidase [Patescibacteria group bacterium]
MITMVEKKKLASNLELLAPAGNMLKLKTAFAYGADAVYLGIPDFSLRVRINDFDLAGIKEGILYAREKGKKVYLTVNIFAHNQHLPALIKFLKKIEKFLPDAFIASDPGIINLLREYYPQVEIHLSTQANCTNLEAARFWQKQGISRIVLGREVTLQQIKKIHQALPDLELEYFVHGAMCMAYSGRCFLSSLFTSRSANLGDCVQPCRWQYDVGRYMIKARGQEPELELVQEKHGTYLLNSLDLCLVRQIPDLIKAGVVSFKIEGRAKSVYYQATVVAIYKRALEIARSKLSVAKKEKELQFLYQELETKLVHRGFTSGFLEGAKAGQNVKVAKQLSKFEFCGQVVTDLKAVLKKRLPAGAVVFMVHNTIKQGDKVEIVLPGYKVIKLKVDYLYDLTKGEKLKEAHGGGGSKMIYIIVPGKTVPAYSVLRRKLK